MALDFFAGCVGGAAGIIVGHPLDTVKVRMQTQCPVNPKYRGTFHCLTSTMRQESIAGLYKGIASPLYGVTAVNALVFGVYGTLKPWISGPGNDALWAHFVAGAVSGSVQSVIASPMELVKTRMQLDESTGPTSKGKSAWNVLKNVYTNEGGLRRGIFKGWCVTLAREIPGLGTYFATYEALTAKTGRDITTFEMMMAGGMAGVASWVMCFPMDVIKTRLQSDITGKYRGAIDCYHKTVSSEGYRALFRGLNSTVIRAFPTNAATFTAVTWIMRLAHQHHCDDFEENKKNLQHLLGQWDSVYLQEKIVDSLRLSTPRYAFLSTANQFRSTTTGGGTGFQDIFTHKFSNLQQLHNDDEQLALTIHLNGVNDDDDETLEARGCNESDPIAIIQVKEEKPKNLMEKCESTSSYVMTDTKNASLTSSSSSSSSSDLTGQVMQEERKSSGMSGSLEMATPLNNTTASSSPIQRQQGGGGGGTNSHEACSLPADLSVLAEILDLPTSIMISFPDKSSAPIIHTHPLKQHEKTAQNQTSLDGKPITLFSIIMTWLTEGTHFNFCKCLDALDHCVCYSR